MNNLTISQITKIDREIRELQAVYSRAKIKLGLELASRLKQVEDGKLFLKLDEKSYPTFPMYLKSVGLNYKTVRELIGLYETYILTAGFTIDQLADIGYAKLTVVKPHLFKKEDGEYRMLTTLEEAQKWVEEAKSDITQEDLRQKVREERAGDHEHDFENISFRKCKLCGLKEYTGKHAH